MKSILVSDNIIESKQILTPQSNSWWLGGCLLPVATHCCAFWDWCKVPSYGEISHKYGHKSTTQFAHLILWDTSSTAYVDAAADCCGLSRR